MKIIVSNNHCDARIVFIPSSRRSIKLPAFGSVSLSLSEREFTDFEVALKAKAPAAQIEIIEAQVVEEVSIEEEPAAPPAIEEEIQAQPAAKPAPPEKQRKRRSRK